MKFFGFLVFTILFQPTFCLSQSNIDIIHYKFEINLSDANDSVYGKAWVTVRFLEQSNRFWLSLASAINGKGMIAHLVKQNGETTTSMHYNDTLLVALPTPAKANDTRTFEILYSGIPTDGLIISKNKYGDRTFFADNWPNRAHYWIPCKDVPDDKATFEFIVNAPAQYQVISNGELVEETPLPAKKKLTHWRENLPLPTKVMVIGVAKFAIKQFADSPANIPVTAWVYPQDSTKGFRNYAPAPAIVKFFSGYIGTYPYKKLANVQSKTKFGGMENASAIFYNEESAEQNKTVEDLLAHEIVHQWFGDMATEKNFQHLWLSEGLATYLTDIYLEAKYGSDVMTSRLREERHTVIDFNHRSSKPVVDSASPLMMLLSPNSYQRPAWVLHMLRRQVGDSMFQAVISKFYERYKGKNADTDDFRKIVEELTGESFEMFFKEWLFNSEIPRLATHWKYNKETGELSVSVTQLQKNLFSFPLDLEIELEDKKAKTQKVEVSKQTETFVFSIPMKVVRLTVDPSVSLLYEEVTSR